jgi:hypothetical protein
VAGGAGERLTEPEPVADLDFDRHGAGHHDQRRRPGARLRVQLLGCDHLRNLAITGVKAPSGKSGGAMLGLGNIVLLHSTVCGNEADGIAAIYATDVTLVNSTVSGNTSKRPAPSSSLTSRP